MVDFIDFNFFLSFSLNVRDDLKNIFSFQLIESLKFYHVLKKTTNSFKQNILVSA